MIRSHLPKWLGGRNGTTTPPRPSDRIEALDANTLLAPFNGSIATIRSRVGVPPQYWHSLYQPVFDNYARLVQRLPASESHHHAGLGGLLQHGLEVTQHALDLRQGVMLPPASSPEEQARLQDLWTYACVTAALLHDLGKPVTDLHVTIHDDRNRHSRSALLGPMPVGASYSIVFNAARVYRQHERIPPLLAHHLIPPTGLQWLASNPDVLHNWLATIQGDLADAAAIGDIIGKADGLSVAHNLSGGAHAQLPTAKAKPLVERLVTGLRYLLDNGDLPLNRRGAAGFVDGDTLWLVSKTVLDKLRTHLIEEGQTGIPSRNNRLMDELQQYGLLVPNGDRAIWHCDIVIDDWRQQLTCLRMEARRVWSDAARRPEAMTGHVKPVDAAATHVDSGTADTTKPNADEPDSAGPAANQDPTTVGEPPDKSTADDLPLPFEIAIADDAVAKAGHESSGAKNAETTAPTPDTAASGHELDGQGQGIDATVDAGERFVAWLKQCIENKQIPINEPQARIHVLPEGLALVSPRIFRDFDSANWSHVQKRFQKLKLHRKTANDENIWTCQVEGSRKQAILKIVLIPNAATTLGINLPRPNPAVKLLDP